MAAGFSGIGFKDLTANLNGSTVQGFAGSDWMDFTDMAANRASATYSGGTLSVTDGTHAASLGVGFAGSATSRSFHVASDGGGGARLTWS